MLVLARRSNESIVFPNLGIRVQVLKLQKNGVRLGIDAPKDVPVLREEIAGENGLSCVDDSAIRARRHEIRNKLHTVVMRLHTMSALLEHSDGVDVSNEDIQSGLLSCLQELAALDKHAVADLTFSSTAADTKTPEVAENRPHFKLDRMVADCKRPPRKSAWRALLVEDDANERELMAGIFRLNGFEVETASDGEEALRALESGVRPDIVLMDMHMPGMNGAEAVSKVRHDERLSALRIFGVSGSDRSDWQIPMDETGVNCWFRKPVDPATLLREVTHQLESSAS